MITMRYLLIAILIATVLGCSPAQTNEELAKRIILLIETQPERWVTVETLESLIYDYRSDDGKGEIVLRLQKTSPPSAIMLCPQKFKFSPGFSAKLQSRFTSWKVAARNRTENY
jgi:hypothetical protein